MGFSINNKAQTDRLNRQLDRAKRQNVDSLDKLSSGTVFTSNDPKPADRAISEGLEIRLRGLAASKRNVNDAVSLLQIAEGSMAEISNMVTRMKEITVAGANTIISNNERKFLFLEYEALYDEVSRIAQTTSFNGIPLLDGSSDQTPDELIFRVGDPFISEHEETSDIDINAIRFEGIKEVVATPDGLGMLSAKDLLLDGEEGISVEDVEDLLMPDSDEGFATRFDEALNTLSTQRAIFSAIQSRMQRSLDFIDVYQENISAAKSKIADTDFAKETANLAQSTILMSATSSLMAQSGFTGQLAINLLNRVMN